MENKTLQLKKASRKQVKLRLGLSGPSGSGKTASALLLAYGITNDWNKVALIDSENDSASLYANITLPNGQTIGEFNTVSITAPFAPEKYIEAIKLCEDAGIEVVVIDSITHEWSGKGGCLDIHEQFTKKMKTPNSYTAWAEVTPRHQAFIDSILQSKCHVITTVRSKTEYVMVERNGKQVPQKMGMAAVTREGFEYELSVSLDVDTDHKASASKDRTGLFMDQPSFIITPETGKQILNWCLTGENPNEAKDLLVKEYKQLLSNDEVFTADEQRQFAYKSNWSDERLERAVNFLKEKIAEKLQSI
jgi:hypothetical protein